MTVCELREYRQDRYARRYRENGLHRTSRFWVVFTVKLIYCIRYSTIDKKNITN